MKTHEILDKIGGAMIILGLLSWISNYYGWLGSFAMFIGVVIVVVSVIIRLRGHER